MKSFFSLVVGLCCLCAAVQAEVPSLINYQGRLTDKAGTPVNGAVDVVLRVYDAKTDGKKVYEETISQVSVVNGVYSFGYGGAGKSTKRAAEVVAWSDGEAKVYNYATAHKPLLGDVQLSDGTYTWGSQNGPSDTTQLIGAVNAELGNVTAIYIQNAPAKDTIINAVYHYHEEGIIGALSQNKECWQELTINGKTLSPRERLVSVPFALMSNYTQTEKNKVFHLLSAHVPTNFRYSNAGHIPNTTTSCARGSWSAQLPQDIIPPYNIYYKMSTVDHSYAWKAENQITSIVIKLRQKDIHTGLDQELQEIENYKNDGNDGKRKEVSRIRKINIKNYEPERYLYFVDAWFVKSGTIRNNGERSDSKLVYFYIKK